MVTSSTDGRVALVTGGAAGIGAACVRRLSADGYVVVAADLDESGARGLAEELAAGRGVVEARRVDVTDPVAVENLVRSVVEAYGRLDVVVNSAGIAGPLTLLPDYPLEDFDRVLRTNLGGTFHTMRAAIPVMRSAGRGAIVNIASIAGSAGFRRHSAYVAAKHAVIGLTKAAAREFGEFGIRVVSVSPGVTATPMTAGLPEEMLKDQLEDVPARRFGRPEEVAAMVAFLVSDEAGYVNGSDHKVDGGRLTQ